MTNNFYCPAPWTSIYYHKDTTISPCHTNRSNSKYLTLSEYIESDWLKNIKSDLSQGKVPLSCSMCFQRESRNLKSTRQSFLRINEGKEQTLNRLELRASNLCNFKCRMCDESSSSEIQKENEKYPVLKLFANTHKIKFDDETGLIDDLKWFMDNYPTVNNVCFTGGEPMLIKTYYQFMDYLIEKKLNDTIILDLYTNCSVYNPLFIDRILQFKRVMFCMSIDGVGRTAEYQRHGTKWDVVEQNILKFVSIPKDIIYNTAISPYVLLDVSSLAKFLMILYKLNNTIRTRCYAVITPQALHFENMNKELRERAVEQIDMAVKILTPSNFDILTKELKGIKHQLLTTEPKNPKLFAQYTQALDKVRGESFEDVFGYKLY